MFERYVEVPFEMKTARPCRFCNYIMQNKRGALESQQCAQQAFFLQVSRGEAKRARRSELGEASERASDGITFFVDINYKAQRTCPVKKGQLIRHPARGAAKPTCNFRVKSALSL